MGERETIRNFIFLDILLSYLDLKVGRQSITNFMKKLSCNLCNETQICKELLKYNIYVHISVLYVRKNVEEEHFL